MMSELPRCDVLVVGAGPAGAMAAGRAASAGVSTWLIDAKRRIGAPSHCAEFVPARIFGEYGISPKSIVQQSDFMETAILDEQAICSWPAGGSNAQRDLGENAGLTLSEPILTRSPGFIIDRVQFDRGLAQSAAIKGALVLCDARLIGYDSGNWLIRRGTSVIVCKPKYVVAADGAQSTVVRLLKLPSPKCVVGVQIEAPLARCTRNALIFLNRRFAGGYGWLFPKGIAANVGVGMELRRGLRPWAVLRALVGYLERHHVIHGGALASSRGLIPVSGPRDSLVWQNVLLCGDAAGLTHPVTGAGVSQALVSGDLAGRLVSAAITKNSSRVLTDYDYEMKRHFGNVMKHALAKRELMTTQWDRHDFAALCSQWWIAYKGYRKRTVNKTDKET